MGKTKAQKILATHNFFGFTLIEVMIASGIIAMISIVIVQVFFATTRANTKTEILKDIKQNGEFTLEIISKIIRSAKSIDSSCSPTGVTTNAITVTNPDGGTTTLACVQDGGIGRIASTSGIGKVEYLTSSDVSVSSDTCLVSNTLSFVCTRIAGTSAAVKISFTLNQPQTAQAQFEKGSAYFQTTAAMRN